MVFARKAFSSDEVVALATLRRKKWFAAKTISLQSPLEFMKLVLCTTICHTLLAISYNISMSRKIALFLISLFAICYSPLAYPTPVSAQTRDWISIDTRCVYDGDVATIAGLECIVGNLLNVAITLIGLGVFAMLLLGAFRFLTSGGDPKAVEAAKGTITTAILGLIVAISAWFIINLIAQFTGATRILNFSTNIDNPPQCPSGNMGPDGRCVGL